MSDRSRITGKTKQGSVSRTIRRRIAGVSAKAKGRTAEIVTVPDSEDFCLKLLRYCPRDISPFRPGLLHVSDLLGKCMRKLALSEQLHKHMPPQSISDSMGLTFAQGTAIHDYVKLKFISGHSDKMYGKWACLCGSLVTEPMLHSEIPQRECPECGTAPKNYRELDLADMELGVVGSPDVILYLSDLEAYYPVELKSITYDDWKEMVRPKPDHVLQVVFYWLLLQRAGYSVPNQVSIVYVSKGFVFKSPYKEFVIQIDSVEDAEERLESYLEDAKALKEFRDGGELPPRSICTNKSCKEAKECHVALACFA